MKKDIQKVAMTSENIENDNLQKLRAVFPQFVKDGSVDFDALQSFFRKEEILADDEKYGLSWAGKSNAFKAIRVPATGTLVPLEKESKNWNATGNIFIEGDNLEALKLLQKYYRGQIKMIYIDPPYNTGKDFIYKDNFTENVSDYYERTGQSQDGIKLTSNMESNGRYHSDWLTMMYPRLFLARNLLKDDGVIFVSIDDNEVANLRMIMDEIFGEENFVAEFVWRKTDNQANIGSIARVKEYIVCYSKNIENSVFNKMQLTDRAKKEYRYSDEKGQFRRSILLDKTRGRHAFEIKTLTGKTLNGPWMMKEKEFKELEKSGGIYWTKGGDEQPYGKIYLEESMGQISNDLLGIEFGTNQQASLEVEELFGARYFDFPKPISLIKHFITIGSNEYDIILDFFAGSGTTAHAVMDLNAEDGGSRKFICVQIPEETDEDSEARKAGYKTIAEISRERIHRAGEAIKHKVNKKIDTRGPSENKNTKSALPLNEKIKNLDIGFKAFSLSPSNYRRWNVLTAEDDEEALLKQAKIFLEKPLVDKYDEQSVIYEILLKEGFDLNSKIVEMKKGGVAYHKVIDGEKEMTVSFAPKLTMDQIDSLEFPKDTTFVCLDSALDDTTKVNIMRNLTVKTI